MTNEPENHEKKSLGTANSSGSPLSQTSGFAKALEKDPVTTEIDGKKMGNPFGVTNPDAENIPTGAPEAAGTGTSSPHISENPDKQ
jgi:hypothetical protein